jgi:8-oxo-dGTP pyrophosphatase MutT (NUDIX family)
MDKNLFCYLTAVEIFLLSPDGRQVLLLKRADDKEVLPGYYGGVGGKMDSPFVETPLEAAYREVHEETGYERADIDGLHLKAVFTVHDRFGKWNVYEFAGQVSEKKFEKLKPMNEGVLEWVDFDSLAEVKLIQDLRSGNLERIIETDHVLWFKVEYSEDDHLLSIEDRED